MRCLTLALLSLAVAVAADARPRLRHEYVPPDVLRGYDPVRGGAEVIDGGGVLPDAIARAGARLDAPGPPDPDLPVMRETGDAPPADPPGIYRPEEARPDRRTGADDALDYHAIYNPTVAPLRRNVAFDRVEADYRLTVAPTTRQRVPIVGDRRARPGRELFWGDVRLELRDRDAPLPSVAPDMRVLALRTEPTEAADGLEIVKDAADNFYLRGPWRGEVRVVFLVDADQRYFASPVPGNVSLGHQQGDPAAALPAQARAAGIRVLAALRVDPEQPFDQGLDALVEHFRGFRAGPPPGDSGDIYEDLALGGVGVCRHRAFAFMITARAAGVPTRVIHNEAHAFVEVRAPDGRWRRIDLGGEAPRLDITGGDGRRLHTPAADAFPKPEAYLDQYSSMLTRGAPPADRPQDGPQIEGAPPALGPGAPEQGGELTPGVGGGIDGPGDEGGAGDPGDAPGVSADPGAGEFTPPAEIPAEVPLPLAPDEVPPDDAVMTAGAPVRVRLDLDEALDVYRGEALPRAVTGRVASATGAEPVAGLRVQVYLVPLGAGRPVAVGPAVTTDAKGGFSVQVELPPTLRLGTYRLVAASDESEAWSAGRSDLP